MRMRFVRNFRQEELPPADPETRLLAAAIDLILYLVPILILPKILIIPKAGWIGWFLASTYLLTKDSLFFGQSMGKRIMNLQVIRIDTGHPAGFKDSVIRNFVFLVPYLNILMVLVEGVLALTEDQGQRFGDRVAGTRVVKGKAIIAFEAKAVQDGVP